MIFISYRRSDSEHATARLHDGLVEHFGEERVFRDTASVLLGEPFPDRVRSAVGACRVLLVVIGGGWLSMRLNDPADWVRIEIIAALERGITIIPVLLPGVTIPPRVHLPEPLQPLVDCNAFSLHEDPAFTREIDDLAEAIGKLTGEAPRARSIAASAKPSAPGVHSTHRLPQGGSIFVGRDEELTILDAAWDGTARMHVVSFVAWGGTGKTALVNQWVARLALEQYRGAQDVYAWSFYSQGTRGESAASADPFVAQALADFGDPDPKAGDAFAKAERLARLLRDRRTLLILDGVEPLQYPPGPEEGRFKDKAFAVLLRELAARNEGLCVVTSRLPLADLASFEGQGECVGKPALRVDLRQLSPKAGAELLRRAKVRGSDAELAQASVDFGGHALALTLLGNWLVEACGADVRRRKEIGPLETEEIHGGHARRVMTSYEALLGAGAARDVLYLIGLFDRPAPTEALDVLRAAPALPGLTDSTVGLREADWEAALSRLRRVHLLEDADPHAPGTVDAHPLVREHFGQRLRADLPDTFRAAHARLYEHYRRTKPDLPDTLEGLAPLYAAVHHGCHAARHQEALDEVYYRRICRGNEFYSTKKLGAFGSDLGALSGFFEEPWTRPVTTLAEADQAWVLNVAGFRLRALGRLRDADGPTRAGLDRRIAREDLKNAALDAANLSELHLALGNVTEAIGLARQCVDLADRSQDAFLRACLRTGLAHALQHAGGTVQIQEAERLFVEAEALQGETDPEYPRLSAVQGYQYCDLLLSRGALDDVLERAIYALEIASRNRRPLEISLDHLSLGRTHLARAHLASADPERRDALSKAREHLDQSVAGLRQAGQQDHFPRGLLARADLATFTRDFPRARTDLAEALDVATRGDMRLHQADAHLAYARLYLAEGDRAKAAEHLALGKALVVTCGYGRRTPDVADLERALGDG